MAVFNRIVISLNLLVLSLALYTVYNASKKKRPIPYSYCDCAANAHAAVDETTPGNHHQATTSYRQSYCPKHKKLQFVMKDRTVLMASVCSLICIGYVIGTLPTGLYLHALLVLMFMYAVHVITSKLYVVNITWCEGIFSINEKKRERN